MVLKCLFELRKKNSPFEQYYGNTDFMVELGWALWQFFNSEAVVSLQRRNNNISVVTDRVQTSGGNLICRLRRWTCFHSPSPWGEISVCVSPHLSPLAGNLLHFLMDPREGHEDSRFLFCASHCKWWCFVYMSEISGSFNCQHYKVLFLYRYCIYISLGRWFKSDLKVLFQECDQLCSI